MTNVLILSESEFKTWLSSFYKFDPSLRFFYNMPCNYPFYIFYHVIDNKENCIGNVAITFVSLSVAEYMVKELKELKDE